VHDIKHTHVRSPRRTVSAPEPGSLLQFGLFQCVADTDLWLVKWRDGLL
jgi:hypothetical protein